MKDFQQRKKMRRMIGSRAVFIVLAIITVLLVRGSFDVYQKERETSSDLVRVKESLNAAEARHLELQSSIERLETTQGLEKEIRDRFSVAKSGEEIVLVVDGKSEVKPVEESKSVWKKMGNWFRNIF